MSKKHRQQMPRVSPDVAMDIIDDDLPDGAYFAMLEDLTGMDAGSAVQHAHRQQQADKPHKCDKCQRRFGTPEGLAQHCRDKHPARPAAAEVQS